MLKMKSRATFVKVAEITKMLAFLTIYNIWKKGWNLEFNCNSMGKRGKEGKKGREGGKGDSHSCSSSGEILYKRLYFWLYFWSIQWKAAEFHQRGVKPPTLPPQWLLQAPLLSAAVPRVKETKQRLGSSVHILLVQRHFVPFLERVNILGAGAAPAAAPAPLTLTVNKVKAKPYIFLGTSRFGHRLMPSAASSWPTCSK